MAVKITFLGTGADDWDWNAFPPGTRGSTCTLVGGSCLVDAGPGVLRGLAAAGVAPARVSDLLVTHSHGDHFHRASIGELARAGRRRLGIWGSPQALAKLDPGPIDLHPVLPGSVFRVRGFSVAALPANHVVARTPDEPPLHYAFSGRGARLLYALDGAWFLAKARLALKAFLGGRPLTAVVWDATCGGTYRDWRFAEHNDLKMIAAMRAAMEKDGLVSGETLHVFDHVARTLWPRAPEAQERLAARFGGVLARDGLSLELPRPGGA